MLAVVNFLLDNLKEMRSVSARLNSQVLHVLKFLVAHGLEITVLDNRLSTSSPRFVCLKLIFKNGNGEGSKDRVI